MQMGVSYKVVYPEKFLKAQARREKEIVGVTDRGPPHPREAGGAAVQQRIKGTRRRRRSN